jgi:microcystin-dependent protein
MGGWNFAPDEWAFCDGSLLSISQNTTLFNLIGTTYGGDGQNTFALPNLLGRVPVHQGTDANGNSYVVGQLSGVETVTLNTNQIPLHTHTLQASAGVAKSTSPTGAVLSSAATDAYLAVNANAAGVVTTSSVTTATGGSQPHTNVMPFQCVTFVISLFGIYPSQN